MAAAAPIARYDNLDWFLGAYQAAGRQGAGEGGSVGALWAGLLGHAFPTAQNYTQAPEYHNAAGFTDQITIHWRRRGDAQRLSQARFLVTQTKRPSRRRHPSAWNEGRNQLRRYLAQLVRDNQGTASSHYGIVAIGQVARFYKWDTQTGDIQCMHGNIDPDVRRDQAIVRRLLRRIKRRH
ncbi:hypothetical protein BJX68DRAFT_264691 [Aspergillus pseudodeflectus]|uniref:Uncharacterized protein n=1 Tax=Aspergillus pseudodeflectus TaxID=176178 RepID=A0ABR4KR96_9EURO